MKCIPLRNSIAEMQKDLASTQSIPKEPGNDLSPSYKIQEAESKYDSPELSGHKTKSSKKALSSGLIKMVFQQSYIKNRLHRLNHIKNMSGQRNNSKASKSTLNYSKNNSSSSKPK